MEIDPAHVTRDTFGGAFYNESGGIVNVSGAGTLTFGGDFHNTERSIKPATPSRSTARRATPG